MSFRSSSPGELARSSRRGPPAMTRVDPVNGELANSLLGLVSPSPNRAGISQEMLARFETTFGDRHNQPA